MRDAPDDLSIDVARSDGQLVVHVAGELDLLSCTLLTERISSIDVAKGMVLDLVDVTFMDSTGLRALWLLHQHAHSGGAELVLRSPSTAVLRLLELSGLRTVFAIV